MRIGSRTVAVITGAAGGIGRALASELAGRGAALALTDIDGTGLDAVAAASKRCSTHVCDIADAEAVRGVATAIVAAHGAVHILINNAGVSVGACRRAHAFLARGMRPEIAAGKIVRGVERGTARVLVGRDTRMIDAATRLAPGLFQAAMRRSWRRVPFL